MFRFLGRAEARSQTTLIFKDELGVSERAKKVSGLFLAWHLFILIRIFIRFLYRKNPSFQEYLECFVLTVDFLLFFTL